MWVSVGMSAPRQHDDPEAQGGALPAGELEVGEAGHHGGGELGLVEVAVGDGQGLDGLVDGRTAMPFGLPTPMAWTSAAPSVWTARVMALPVGCGREVDATLMMGMD
jgi:hypothetical protein